MIKVGLTFGFEASHQLTLVPEDHKCRRLHGHSYQGTVVVKGELDDRKFVIEYEELRAILRPLVERCDHHYLNDALPFETTCENLVQWFGEQIEEGLPAGVDLVSVRIWETPRAWAEYSPQKETA